jgi:hypothetical protein
MRSTECGVNTVGLRPVRSRSFDTMLRPNGNGPTLFILHSELRIPHFL